MSPLKGLIVIGLAASVAIAVLPSPSIADESPKPQQEYTYYHDQDAELILMSLMIHLNERISANVCGYPIPVQCKDGIARICGLPFPQSQIDQELCETNKLYYSGSRGTEL